jgi:transposase
MRQVREILRHKLLLGQSHRQVAASLKVGLGTISSMLKSAAAAGLAWADVETLSEDDLDRRLRAATVKASVPRSTRPLPDPARLHLELRRVGVTLQLLHQEYREHHPDGYGYTQFCGYYGEWLDRQSRTMRQVHRAGEKLFVDYSGKRPSIVDPNTGNVTEAELFVAAMGASNWVYAEATATQQIPDWIAAHTNALEALGGVPQMIVPDQLKSGVSVSCRYEPTIQRTYQEWAVHYGTVIVPARPRHPRDKAKVEVSVQIVQRFILARLRHEVFFSLRNLNARIFELTADLNRRVMRGYGKSRQQLLDEIDRPVLKALPLQRFEYGVWKIARVNIDYHVEVERSFYSVPHALVHEAVEVRLTLVMVEVFHRGQRIASHVKSLHPGHHSTIPEHMPKSHAKHLEWTPSRLIAWGAKMGPGTARLITAILEDRPHPELGYRSCLGILRLERSYGKERLEIACTRAMLAGARSYKHVDSMLKLGLDRLPLRPVSGPPPPVGNDQDHLRGSTYYE